MTNWEKYVAKLAEKTGRDAAELDREEAARIIKKNSQLHG